MKDKTMKGLLAGMDIDELKRRTKLAPWKEYWKKMTKRWREIAEWEEKTGKTVIIGSCAGQHIAWFVREAALEFRLTGNEEALKYVEKQIAKLAGIFLYHPENWKKAEHPYWSESDVCLAADMCRDELSEKSINDLLRMVRECFWKAPFIGWDGVYRYLGGHNMMVTEHVCAGICMLVWGKDAECENSEEIIKMAIQSAKMYCRQGLDQNGYGYEGTMYTAVPMDTIYLFGQLLYQNKMENLFETIPVLKKYPAVVRNLLFPDRTGLTPLSDGGIYHCESYAWLLLTGKYYDRPEDIGLWYEYRGPGKTMEPCKNNNPSVFWPDSGEKGPVRRDGWGHDLFPFLWLDEKLKPLPVEKSPDPLCLYSEGTELAFFRTSWSKNAVYLNVSGQGRSHCSLDHAHADGGHFTIFAHGEYLAIDTGYWNVLENHHSVVLIDGKTQFNRNNDENHRRHYAGRLKGFQHSDMLDYIMADQAAPRNCVWNDRHFLFVKLGGDRAYIVIVDNVNPDHSKHTFQWQLQAHPDSEIEIVDERTAIIQKDRVLMDITFILPLPTDFPTCPHVLNLRSEPVYGAMVASSDDEELLEQGAQRGGFIYTRKEALAMKSDLSYSNWYRPCLIAEQTGPNCLLMAIISPRPADTKKIMIKDASGHRVMRVEIYSEDFCDTVIAALDHGLIRFYDINGDTELAFVRRDRKGQVLGCWTIDGSPLNII